MVKVQVQTFQAPRWVVPVMILIALALIPFTLMIGLAVAALALGFTALRVLLPSPNSPSLQDRPNVSAGRKIDSHTTVIDADYEVKDENGKD